MSVHAPLANRRQTMDTASLRQDDFEQSFEERQQRAEFQRLALEEAARQRIAQEQEATLSLITVAPTPTTADDPTVTTTVVGKTLAQDPGFIFLAAGLPDFPAFTTWTHPQGSGDKAWIQLFGPDATSWMLELINNGLAVLRSGAVAPSIMVVPIEQVVGGEALAPTQIITTTADLEPSAPSLAVDTGVTGGRTILRGATTTPITTGVTRTRVLGAPEVIEENGITGGIPAVGGIAALAIGALFLFGRRR